MTWRLCTVLTVVLQCVTAWALQTDYDGDGLTDDMELRLARTFAPVLHFHPQEVFYPSAVEPYLDVTDLYFQRHHNAPACKLTTEGKLTLPVLTVASAPAEEEVCADGNVPSLRGGSVVDECSWLALKCDLFNVSRFNVVECSSPESRVDQFFFVHAGRAIKNPFNASAPVYIHVHPADVFGERSIVLQYWFFYSFNGPLDDMLTAGAHEGDWEHVSVVIDDATRQHVRAVYMAAHSHEARWLFPADVQLNGTHMHSYVALHSHAMYETSGVKKRLADSVLYSFLHDHCSDAGHEWRPDVFVNMGEKECPLVPWGYYNGYWGSKKLIYSFIPLPFDTASPPRGPMHQTDYWFVN